MLQKRHTQFAKTLTLEESVIVWYLHVPHRRRRRDSSRSDSRSCSSSCSGSSRFHVFCLYLKS